MLHKIAALIACLFIGALASAAPTAEDFGNLPGVYDAAISPDGQQLALIYKLADTYGVSVISLHKSDTKQRAILLGEGVKPLWVRWANDNRVLAGIWQSVSVRGVPASSSYIYTLDANTMKGKYLVQSNRIFRQNNSYVIDFLDADPKHILMGYSNDDQFITDIRRVHVVSGDSKRIKRGRKSIQRWYTDHRGEPRIGQGLVDSYNSKTEKWRLTIRDVDSEKWRDVDEYPGLDPKMGIFGFTGDPNELVVGRYAGKDTLGIYVYDLAKKQIAREIFHHDTFDVSGLVVNSITNEIIGARYVADTPEVELFDGHDTLMQRMRRRFEGYSVDYVDLSNDGNVLIFKISNAFEPGALMMVSKTDVGKPSLLVKYRPELPADEMGNVLSVGYKARDDAVIPAYVTLPPSIGPGEAIENVPFIILPHGGPYARTSKRFDYFAQFFATRGYGVLQMNFRGSSGYGKTFQDSGRENWVVMQEDVTDGAKWLIRKGYTSPDRLCIAGWSYGGYAALMGAIKHPEMYSCAISMAGVTDLQDMVRDLKKYRFGNITARKSILDGFDGNAELKENSPIRRAMELKVPLFLAHGTKDQRVQFDQFKRMKSALRKNAVPATFVEFEDEDHFLSSQKNRQEFFIKLDKFLTKTMGKSEFAQ